MPMSTANMWYNCFVCKKHNFLGVIIKTVTLQVNISLLGCFACLTAYTVSESQLVPDYSPPPRTIPLAPSLIVFFVWSSSSVQLSLGFFSSFKNHKRKIRIFLLVFFKTLVNLRKSTAEERRRQTLCDKRDNNFHLPLTTNSLYACHVCHKEAFCRPLLSIVGLRDRTFALQNKWISACSQIVETSVTINNIHFRTTLTQTATQTIILHLFMLS